MNERYDNTQECYLCKTEKDLDSFIRRKDGKYYRMCKDCNEHVQRKKLEREKGQKNIHTSTHRTCYKCQRFLTNDNFTLRSVGSYYSACKECNKYGFAQTRRARMHKSGGIIDQKEFQKKLAQNNFAWAINSCPKLPGGIPRLRNDSKWNLNESIYIYYLQ